jgi:hypothetical protein
LKGVPGKYRFEGVVVVDEAVSDACLVNIEAARSAQPVDADNLSGSRARELFVLELLGGSQVNSLTIPEVFLGKRFAGFKNRSTRDNSAPAPAASTRFSESLNNNNGVGCAVIARPK